MERPAPAFEGDKRYVFVSYSHADQSVVYPEIRWLQDQSVNVWYDEGISGASRWRDAIAGKIAQCDLFVIYMSDDSAASKVCREELEYALDQDRQILSIFIVPTQVPDGIRLAINSRQALLRYELEAEDYQRKYWAAVSGHLNIDLTPDVRAMPVVKPTRRVALSTAAMVAFASLSVGIFVAGFLFESDARTSEQSYRFDIATRDPMVRFAENDIGVPLPGFTLTNSGSHLIYVGESDGTRHLYQRDMKSGEVRRLLGTENAALPLISPDDAWIAFLDDNTFYKVPAGGGRRARLAQTDSVSHASWSLPNRLFVMHEDGRRETVVAADGRVMDTNAVSSNDPIWSTRLLPGGTHALATDYEAELLVANLSSREFRKLGITGISPEIRRGYVFATTLTGISAARFDEEQAKLTSPVVTIELPVRTEWPDHAQWSLADNGLLVYAPGVVGLQQSLFWGSANGLVGKSRFDGQSFGTFSLSPNGRMLAARHFSLDSSRSSVWLYDVDDGFARLIVDEEASLAVLTLEWLPDSSGLYMSDFIGSRTLFYEVGSATYQDVSAELHGSVNSVAGEGPLLALRTGQGIRLVNLADGTSSSVTDESEAWGAQISPDGAGVAYVSVKTGAYQVVYTPMGSPDRLIQVSREPGSEEPRWNRDGTRLYFRKGNRIMVAERFDSSGRFSQPKVFWEGSFTNVAGRSYDIKPDESAALMIEAPEQSTDLLHVETNWFGRVERLIQEAEARED